MSCYEEAKKMYAALGIDTDAVLDTIKNVPVSIHCWQGNDVIGFESGQVLSVGIQTTGNYPGKATNPEQLMADIDKALLNALLQPHAELKALQDAHNTTKLMVMQENLKTMPIGDIWAEYLRRENVAEDYLTPIVAYEQEVLSKR